MKKFISIILCVLLLQMPSSVSIIAFANNEQGVVENEQKEQTAHKLKSIYSKYSVSSRAELISLILKNKGN